jgi:hypothetical protein
LNYSVKYLFIIYNISISYSLSDISLYSINELVNQIITINSLYQFKTWTIIKRSLCYSYITISKLNPNSIKVVKYNSLNTQPWTRNPEHATLNTQPWTRKGEPKRTQPNTQERTQGWTQENATEHARVNPKRTRKGEPKRTQPNTIKNKKHLHISKSFIIFVSS